MNRRFLFLLSILCCCGPIPAAHGQKPRSDASEVLKQLLAMPAPRPPNSMGNEKASYPASFFDKDKIPPDDAPIADLIAYWNRWGGRHTGRPSDTVAERLLEACIAEPKLLVALLGALPHTKPATVRIKEVYDKAELSDYDRDTIRSWLVFNSTFFLDELLAKANKVKDADKTGDVENKAALIALARVEWETAEPLLRNLTASQPRSAALAQSLFYKHAIKENEATAEEQYRNSLKAIASNRNLPGFARDLAIDTLTSTEWSGRDEWYLGLFQDETLVEAPDGIHTFSPLTKLFASNPDKWIPIMARLVESKDLTVRSAAARCLITFHNPSARRDALLPLLPWLSNPTWVSDVSNKRQYLIMSMGVVEMPESVPGLIWVVENSDADSAYDRGNAAHALAKYKDPRAAPALKKALAKERREDYRHQLIEGLLASQGLTDAEQLEALEAYAAQLTTPQSRADVERYRSPDEDQLPLQLEIGKYLSSVQVASESLIQAVLIRAESLKPENLPVAKALIEVAHRWQGRQVDLDMINRIGNGSADATSIMQALKRRDTMRQSLSPELHTLTAAGGPASGIGAVLLENQALAHDVLTGKDQLAQIALLACSRLTNNSLPVDLVGPLLRSKNALLAQAAEAYLLIEDSKQAQELLWQHHPNQAFVTGWGENAELVYGNRQMAAKAEAKLRDELFKENGPLEIIALIHQSDVNEDNRFLRIYSDKAIYTHYEDSARYLERDVSKAELASLKQFLAAKNLQDSGPQFGWCHHTCTSEEFLTLTKEKGRRVFSEQGFEVWIDLRENFDLFREGAKVRYNLEKEIKGIEVLYANKDLEVRDVWQKGDEIRILVERKPTDAEFDAEVDEDDEDESEAARNERWRRSIARRNSVFSWRLYANHKVGAVTSQPEVYSTIDAGKFPPDNDDDSILDDEDQVQKLSADSVIIAREDGGLFKQFAGAKPVRVGGEGSYSNPIATPDGKWVVVAKADRDFSEPNYVVRFNVRTGREYRVNIEPAGEFFPVAFVPLQGKVLLRRARDEYDSPKEKGVGPERPEHYLLDPVTGETRLVSGELGPLYDKGKRSLQPTGEPNEVWAAIPDDDKKQTQVGRYNVKDFTFKSVLAVPQISFDSLSMWVDGTQKKVYVVYKDQLLRLPLQLTQE